MFTLFAFAVLLSAFCQLIVISLFRRYGYFGDDIAYRKPQSVHRTTVPRAGGIGIFVALGLVLPFPLGEKLFFSLALAFASGILEDFSNRFSPKIRLFMQAVAAVSAVFLLHAVVTYIGLGFTMPYLLGALFSVFAIVGMMNAFNIIDGFNGLAAGTALLILLSLGITAYRMEDVAVVRFVAISVGALIAFLAFNFPKAHIFLGDGGAYLIGFVVSIVGIFLASHYDSVSPWYILSIFIYPVWEVLFSILRRIRKGASAFGADAMHLHTLVYRHVTKENAATTRFILSLLFPHIALATLFAHHSLANIVLILFFIGGYLYLYRRLYRKESA